MSIFEHLKDIYEHQSSESVNERLAAFMLINYDRLAELSLTTIAQETNVPKGTVSKLIHRLSAEGTYSTFIEGVKQEKEIIPLRQAEIADFGREYKAKYLPKGMAKEIAKAIGESDELIVVSSSRYYSISANLIDELLLSGKEAKCLGNYYSESNIANVLTCKGVIIVIDIDDDLDHDMKNALLKSKAKCYYLDSNMVKNASGFEAVRGVVAQIIKKL